MLKKTYFLVFLFIIGVITLIFAEEEKMRVAVFDFRASPGIEEGDARGLSAILRTEFVKLGYFDVITRNELENIVEENKFQMTGFTTSSEEERIEFGELFNIRNGVMGSVSRSFGRIVISVEMIDLQTGRITFADNIDTTEAEVFDELRELAKKMTDLIAKEQNNSPIANELYATAKALFDNENYREASDHIKKALDLLPDNPTFIELSKKINIEIDILSSEEEELRRNEEEYLQRMALNAQRRLDEERERQRILEEERERQRQLEEQERLSQIRAERWAVWKQTHPTGGIGITFMVLSAISGGIGIGFNTQAQYYYNRYESLYDNYMIATMDFDAKYSAYTTAYNLYASRSTVRNALYIGAGAGFLLGVILTSIKKEAVDDRLSFIVLPNSIQIMYRF